MTPLTAATALDQFFLDARCRLLDIAAILDRIDRGDSAPFVLNDPRMAKIRQAIALLAESGPGRAERIQKLFSQEYDPNWQKPQPR